MIVGSGLLALIVPLTLPRFTLARFALTQLLLCLVHLLTQLLQAFADAVFRSTRAGIDAPAQVVSSPLHAVGQVALIHSTERVTQL